MTDSSPHKRPDDSWCPTCDEYQNDAYWDLVEQLEKLKKDYDDLRDHRVVLVNSSTTQNDESRPEGRPS